MKTTEDRLFEKYGPRLSTDDLAEVLRTSTQNIRKDICRAKFPIPTFKAKPGRRAPRFADYRAVAKHIDETSASAVLASPRPDAYISPKSASPSSR
jgi:hypothetical protein